MEDFYNDNYREPVKKKTKEDYQKELDKQLFHEGLEVDEKFFERTYETNWLIPDLIERNKVCVLYGQKGTNKSFIALHIGWLFGNGYQVLGSNLSFDLEDQMFVKYLALEDSEQHNVRLDALNTIYPYQKAEDEDHRGFSILKEHFRLDGTLLNLAKIEQLTIYADLLIIDTVSYMYPDGDETKGNIARLVMHELARCAEQNECTIIALHHPPENNDNKLRGSSEMANSVNTIIQNKKGRLKTTKQRNGQVGKIVNYKTIPTLKSLTVEFTNPKKDLNQYEKAILDIVESADKQRISDTDLRKEFVKRFPDTKSIYQVFKRAKEKNLTLKFLSCEEKNENLTYKVSGN